MSSTSTYDAEMAAAKQWVESITSKKDPSYIEMVRAMFQDYIRANGQTLDFVQDTHQQCEQALRSCNTSPADRACASNTLRATQNDYAVQMEYRTYLEAVNARASSLNNDMEMKVLFDEVVAHAAQNVVPRLVGGVGSLLG